MKRILVWIMLLSVAFGNLTPLHAEGEFVPAGTLLKLEDSLRYALSDHGRLRILKARLEKEDALLTAVKRGFFPKLKTEVYTALATGDKRGILFWTSEIRLPIFEGGRRVHEIRMKNLDIEIEKTNFDEARRQIAFEVKAIYIALLREKELTRLAQGWVKEAHKLYLGMEVLFKNELITREELLKWRFFYKAACHELLKHKEAMDYGESLIRELSGVKASERIELEPLTQEKSKKIQAENFSEDLRAKHPLYQKVQFEVQRKEEERKILKSERFPKLALSTRFNAMRDTYIHQNRFELGVVGSWNIWDFGVLGNEIKAKEAEIRETEEKGKIKIQEFEKKLRKLMSDLRIGRDKIKLSKSFFKERKIHYQNERRRWEKGLKSETELFQAFANLIKAQMKFVDSIVSYRILEADFDKSLGKEILN